MKFGRIDTYLLFGGGLLLSECAVELKEMGYSVLVVTSPRHSEGLVSDGSTTFTKYLVEHDIEHVVTKDMQADDITNRITSSTLGISSGAAWIFHQSFIDRFGDRLLNLHGARLPRDRGAGGFSWQILRDNRLGCCLLHQVDAGVDTGPIIKYREFVYPTWCRIPKDYKEIYFQENRSFLSDFFKEVESVKEFEPVEQLEYLSTYWPRLSTEHHGYLNWSWSLRQIERFICAFDEPYKGASTFVNKKRVFFKNCFVDFNDGGFHPFQTGMVYKKSPGVLFVATEDGTLVLGSVTDEDSSDVMSEIRIGDRFYTPSDVLEQANIFRAVYTPEGLRL